MGYLCIQNISEHIQHMTDFRTYAYKITNPEVHKVKLTCCGDFIRTGHLLSQFQSLITDCTCTRSNKIKNLH